MLINVNSGKRNLVSVDRLRYRLRERLQEVIPDRPVSSLIYALSLGDRSAIDSSQWQVLSRTGTNHLLAISGLHIGLIAGFGFFFGEVDLAHVQYDPFCLSPLQSSHQ